MRREQVSMLSIESVASQASKVGKVGMEFRCVRTDEILPVMLAGGPCGCAVMVARAPVWLRGVVVVKTPAWCGLLHVVYKGMSCRVWRPEDFV